MQIEFKNGSKIESIDTLEKPVRTKKYEEFIKYIRANPYQFYLKYTPCKLRWYQKIWLWIMCKFSKSLEGL